MPWRELRKLLRRIHSVLHRERLARELEAEMAAHREMMPPDRLRAFGNTLQLHDEIRDTWGWLWLITCGRTWFTTRADSVARTIPQFGTGVLAI